MWIKSDRWGTVNWGQLSQATDNVALLPDLSGTIIESNAVLFDGPASSCGRRASRHNAEGLRPSLGAVVTTAWKLVAAIGADCNGYPKNGVRYDSPTWGGFSVSGGFGEDDTVDVAVKYAADWNNFKVSAASASPSDRRRLHPRGSPPSVLGVPTRPRLWQPYGLWWRWCPFQGFRRDATVNQVGASVLHVPTGLFIYGMYQREENNGTSLTFDLPGFGAVDNANETDVWYVKAGIKRTWTPLRCDRSLRRSRPV